MERLLMMAAVSSWCVLAIAPNMSTRKYSGNLHRSLFFCQFKLFVYFCKKIISMPEISKFYGIIILMYIDDHNPPHFHVRYEGDEAVIDINDGHITGSLPRRALRLVYEWLDIHKDELLENWDKLKNSMTPSKIDPLR